jgi:GAF domain-containing protein
MRPSTDELLWIADEQAALRHVATLVARAAPPAEVFAAVAEEVGRVLPAADVTYVGRYDSAGGLEVVGGWRRTGAASFVGARVRLGGRNVATLVYDSHEPARVDHLAADASPATALARLWARSSAGAPITVEGRLWGVVTVGSQRPEGLPTGLEHQLADFTELVATAIANSEAHAELRALADEQAALRHVATLVARGERPDAVFAALAEEAGRLLAVDLVLIAQVLGDSMTGVAGWSRTGDSVQLPAPLGVGGLDVTEAGPTTTTVRASVGAPISIHGRVWGLMVASSTQAETLPAGTEQRLATFTDLAATAIANSQAHEELRAVADEQAALRHVATLVARGEPPAVVFAGVAEEVGRVLPAGHAYLGRYETADTVRIIAAWGALGDRSAIGRTVPATEQTASGRVRVTGRPLRVDYYAAGAGPPPSIVVEQGVRCVVAAPITVEGRLWGLIAVGSRLDEPEPPAGVEQRLGGFTDLMATAIANTESREELTRIADEQAALRRLATLVARGVPPAEVLQAVTEEVSSVLRASGAITVRFDADGESTVLASVGDHPAVMQVGRRIKLEPPLASGRVLLTGRSARTDDYTGLPAPLAEAVRRMDIRSSVATPILVGGHLWGAIAVVAQHERFPPDTERRLTDFTELVATAISNAEAQAELTASRARIVTTTDETRRRIERDLHDGAQQRLVQTVVTLKLARRALRDPGKDASELVDEALGNAEQAIEEVRELARGIHPRIVSEGGLGRALATLAHRCPIPVALDMRTAERLPEGVEVTAYYVVSEALTNAAKHSHATSVQVSVERTDGEVRLSISDDGIGGANASRGSGLVGLTDRVEATGGRLTLDSPLGEGTSLVVELPMAHAP